MALFRGVSFVTILFSVVGQCDVMIGGLFPMRRSPPGIQREVGARASFCEFYDNSVCKRVVDGQGDAVIIEVESPEDDHPPIKFVYQIYSESSKDDNSASYVALNSALKMIGDTQKCVAFLGPNNSGSSKPVQDLVSIFHVPHISYASTAPELSNKERNPTFFRTVASDAHQAVAIAAMVAHFGWKNIFVLHSNDNYGDGGATELVAAAKAKNIKSTVQGFFPQSLTMKKIDAILDIVEDTKITVIVLICLQNYLEILTRAATRGLVGERFTWIAADGWSAEWQIFAKHPDIETRGMLGVRPARVTGPLASAFGDRWTKRWNNATENEVFIDFPGEYDIPTDDILHPLKYDVYGPEMNSYVPFAYDAMMLLMTAVDSLRKEGTTPCTTQLEEYRKILTLRLNETTFMGITGNVAVRGGDRMMGYDMTNAQGDNGEWKTIGHWEEGKGYVEQGTVMWSDGMRGVENVPTDSIKESETAKTQQFVDSKWVGIVAAIASLFLFVLVLCVLRKKLRGASSFAKSLATSGAIVVVGSLFEIADSTTNILVCFNAFNGDPVLEKYKEALLVITLTGTLVSVCSIVYKTNLMCKSRDLLHQEDDSMVMEVQPHVEQKSATKANIVRVRTQSISKRATQSILDAYVAIQNQGEELILEPKDRIELDLHLAEVTLFLVVFKGFPDVVLDSIIVFSEDFSNKLILVSFSLTLMMFGRNCNSLRDIGMLFRLHKHVQHHEERAENRYQNNFMQVLKGKGKRGLERMIERLSTKSKVFPVKTNLDSPHDSSPTPETPLRPKELPPLKLAETSTSPDFKSIEDMELAKTLAPRELTEDIPEEAIE